MKPQTRQMLEQYIQQVRMNHALLVEDLAVAFIVRTGIDPELCEVVTRHFPDPDGGLIIRTSFERKKHGTSREDD